MTALPPPVLGPDDAFRVAQIEYRVWAATTPSPVSLTGLEVGDSVTAIRNRDGVLLWYRVALVRAGAAAGYVDIGAIDTLGELLLAVSPAGSGAIDASTDSRIEPGFDLTAMFTVSDRAARQQRYFRRVEQLLSGREHVAVPSHTTARLITCESGSPDLPSCLTLVSESTGDWCVPASIATILSFFGSQVSVDHLASTFGLGSRGNSRGFDNRQHALIASAVAGESSGTLTTNDAHSPPWDFLTTAIDRNHPVLDLWTGHATAIFGYDEQRYPGNPGDARYGLWHVEPATADLRWYNVFYNMHVHAYAVSRVSVPLTAPSPTPLPPGSPHPSPP